jgi:hypothetical protein
MIAVTITAARLALKAAPKITTKGRGEIKPSVEAIKGAVKIAPRSNATM